MFKFSTNRTTMNLTCSLLYLVLLTVTVTVNSSTSFYPPPFFHKPNIPPSTYNGDNQKYLTLPNGPKDYPPPPPPPPGFSAYGAHSYKDKSGVKTSDVVAGMALWELMKNTHHHQYYGIQTQQNAEPNYHDVIRERYTTKIIPRGNLIGPAAYNILEMTHYVTLDSKGVIFSSEGNSACISIYNAEAMTNWHKKQLKDFHKLYPNSTFPLYTMGNYTRTENFTVIPGRIVHREPISITCCGSSKEKINLNYLTNGRHPEVNCVNHLGNIPIRKLVFKRIEERSFVNTTDWHEIELIEPNVTSTDGTR